MKIENKIKKRIKTIAIINNQYPKEIRVTKEEWEELGKPEKYEGVKLKVE